MGETQRGRRGQRETEEERGERQRGAEAEKWREGGREKQRGERQIERRRRGRDRKRQRADKRKTERGGRKGGRIIKSGRDKQKRDEETETQRHREKNRDEQHSETETDGGRKAGDRTPETEKEREWQFTEEERGEQQGLSAGSSMVSAVPGSQTHVQTFMLSASAPWPETSLPQKDIPWGSLLPVDQDPQGILGVQGGLRGQLPPVEDRGTEVMRSAKFEPG